MGNNETNEYPFGKYEFNDNIDEKNESTFGDYKYNDKGNEKNDNNSARGWKIFIKIGFNKPELKGLTKVRNCLGCFIWMAPLK